MAFCQWSVANYFLTLESYKHVLSLYSKFKSVSLLLLRITFFKTKQERRELLKITDVHTDIKNPAAAAFGAFWNFQVGPIGLRSYFLTGCGCMKRRVCVWEGGERGKGACFWGWRMVASLQRSVLLAWERLLSFLCLTVSKVGQRRVERN